MRGFCSDFGVESGIADVPNVLPLFFEYLRKGPSGITTTPEPGTHLFRRAVFVPGWNHLVDNVLKDMSVRLSFWPTWVATLKAIVKIIRYKSNRVALKTWLAERGQAQQAKCLDSFSAAFAHWRWGTLAVCCKRVAELAFLRETWPTLAKQIFPNPQDKSTMDAVAAGFGDSVFWVRLRFMGKITQELETLRLWGAGCSCHQEQLLQGARVDCHLKGRRLHEASARVDDCCAVLRQAANQLDLGQDCSGDELLHMQARHSYLYAAAMLYEKTAFVRRIPYLLARCTTAEVASECVRQYDLEPEGNQHRVSQEFLSPTNPSSLRKHVDALSATGELAGALRLEVSSLQHIRISEDVLEGAHRPSDEQGQPTNAQNATCSFQRSLSLFGIWC